MLASMQGGLLNASDLARSMGVMHPIIKHYIDLLEGTCVISRLPPYFVNIGKGLVKSHKVYIWDSDSGGVSGGVRKL
jgi:predicted AAA+ superfamily ATPase